MKEMFFSIRKHILVFLCCVICIFSTSSFAVTQQNHVDNESEDIVYLTGFTPFLNYSVNPSELIVNDLNQTMVEEYLIYGRVLPVDFEQAPKIIQNDIQCLNPDLIICLGLDPSCNGITIELVSINVRYDPVVNDSWKTLQRIDRNGPFFIPTLLNAQKSYEGLMDLDIPASYSLSAGLYVCNAVFYETVFYLKHNSLDIPMGFIHIPHDADTHENGLDLEIMKKGILSIMVSNIS